MSCYIDPVVGNTRVQSHMGACFFSTTKLSGRIWVWSHYSGQCWYSNSVWSCFQHYDGHSYNSDPSRSKEKEKGTSMSYRIRGVRRANFCHQAYHCIANMHLTHFYSAFEDVCDQQQLTCRTKTVEYASTTAPQVHMQSNICYICFMNIHR